MINHILQIMTQRETNLIHKLKSRLDKINKQVQSAKHRLRYSIDLILQGNIKDLDGAFSNAYNNIMKTEAEFKHLLRLYPNNRFVSRSYTRFLRDIIGEPEKYREWSSKTQTLQKGIMVKPDESHALGMKAFPNLPKTIDVNAITDECNSFSSEENLTVENVMDEEEAALDFELKIGIRKNINELSVPGYKYSKIVSIISFMIFILLPSIALLIISPLIIDSYILPLSHLENVASLRFHLFQIDSMIFARITFEYDKLNKTPHMENLEPVHFGHTSDPYGQIDSIIDDLDRDIGALTSFNLLSAKKRLVG